MKATTHTEVYRPFRGELRKHPMAAATLAWSGIRIGFRKKMPMLALFTIPAITTIVFSFLVQLRFEAAAGSLTGMAGAENEGAAVIAGQILADRLGEVEALALQLLGRLKFFVVLAMGWYGSGLIAEDKKLRANLLYFARPITRWTYIRGKLGTVCFWGACTVVLPITSLCSVAAFASPNWSFVTESWPVILKLEAFAILWVLVHGLLVLALSSVCEKRNQALAGLFGVYFLSHFGSEAMTRLFDGQGWRLASIPRNFERLSESMFGISSGNVNWSVEASIWMLGAVSLVSFAVISWQARKMELGR